MRRRATGVALSALVVLALVAVVGIASTGSSSGGSNATHRPSEAVYDTLYTLWLIAVALGGGVLVYGLAQRKAIARQVASGKYRRTSLLTFLTGIVLFTALFYFGLIRFRPPEGSEGADSELAFPGEASVPTLPEGAQTSYEPAISWPSIAVVVGLIVAAVAAYAIGERRARSVRSEPADLTEELAAALDESLGDLRAEPDARKAIIAAYARLERVLAANGIPRASSETPDEYLLRVLRDLRLDSGAIERLTALFTRAKFSPHDVDATMKEDAIGALEQMRDELRRASELGMESGSPPLSEAHA